MINKIILVGNVGKDPEVRTVGTDKVANFSLATTETYKNKDGEKVKNTQWHNIVAWKHLAELCEKYITKGKQLYIEGSVNYRSYEKGGETKYITEVKATSIQMLGSKSDSGQSNQDFSNLPGPDKTNLEQSDYSCGDQDLPF
jgi:single-strand DNA-binding protein